MLAAQRRAAILSEVARSGVLRVAHLAAAHGVSEVTIRRDIDELSDQGLVRRVHGGVMAVGSSVTAEPAFAETSQSELESKKAIAREAATLVQPGQALALMGGSTVYYVALELLSIPSLTILTNSIPIFEALDSEAIRSDWTVVLAGGVRTPTDSLVGTVTEEAFHSFNFDHAFIGTYGMDSVGGFSSPSMVEAELNRVVMGNAKSVVILADHTKWNVRGFSSFGALSSADVVIVDDHIDDEVRGEVENHVSRLRLAPTAPALVDQETLVRR